MKKQKIILAILILLVTSFLYADITNIENKITQLIDDSSISPDSVFNYIENWNDYQDCENKGQPMLLYNQISDTLNAPYVVYIPKNYNPKSKTPLLLILHGGVGVSDFFEEPIRIVKDNLLIPYTKRENWIVLYPLGKKDYTWWDLAGIKNIQQQILYLKKSFNIDDDRIYVTGFSDGGSGSFYLGLTNPDMFASFYPLNGFISVGSIDSETPIYLKNLMNRPTFAINTDLDNLYPAKNMKPIMELSISKGADILYKEYYDIGHEFKYSDKEIPIMIQNMKNNPRNIFRPMIYWETWTPKYGKCDWIEILELDTLQIKKSWQEEFNCKIPDKRIIFGFYHDDSFQETGIKVKKLIEDECPAKEMGLQANDIIIKMDNKPTNKIEDMSQIKKGKKRGDKVSLTILRDGKQIKLFGQFPDTSYFDAFIYNKPAGAVKARYCGNEFDVKTSQVRKISIYLHPDMINFENPVIVNINEKEVFNQKINMDKEFIISNFLENYDRSALWCNKLTFEVE